MERASPGLESSAREVGVHPLEGDYIVWIKITRPCDRLGDHVNVEGSEHSPCSPRLSYPSWGRPSFTAREIPKQKQLYDAPQSVKRLSHAGWSKTSPLRRLNKAAGAADATRETHPAIRVACGSQGGACDPSQTSDAGGTPAA
jgi:hypothetical protein